MQTILLQDMCTVHKKHNVAWGNQVSNLGSNISSLSFAGGLYDEHTGLVRFGARDYNPTIGRWISKDPIGFDGGQSNLYSYVDNNPIIFVDITGQGKWGYRGLYMGGGYYLPFHWTLGGEEGNILLMHEQYWFNDGTSKGYGDGIWVEEFSYQDVYKQYVFLFSKEYNDKLMRDAMNLVLWNPKEYFLVGHNCQDWASAVREKYRELEKNEKSCP